MPHSYIESEAPPSSSSREDLPSKGPASDPDGPRSKESSPSQPSGSKSGGDSGSVSPDELPLEATEPFPPDLFRVPVPDEVFSQMPELSDSALRCLLALVHLSFRFDPEKSSWVHPGDWFSRQKVEEASNLSDQATRNGLDELESLGWAEVDRSNRSHQHRLLLEVPDRRFTYVPTALLEQASGIGSGTALRVVLTVIRKTWGWTCQSTDPESGREEPVHDRWAQLSNRELAGATGRSETAVARAARALQGEWIERVRPGNGPYQYRFLPERIAGRPEEESSVSTGTANDLAPHRQKSGTPTFSKESFSRDKHRSQKKDSGGPPGEEPSPSEAGAVPTENSSERAAAPKETSQTSNSKGEAPPPDFSDLPPDRRELAVKLSNVGLWAGRIAEVLSRFSIERIRANFELYRRRSAEHTIRKPGAWLYAAITDGYALPDSSIGEPEGSSSEASGTLPPLQHKETVSEAKKDAYVAQGTSEERFHRCPPRPDRPEERRFMYFDPEVGGPSRRRSAGSQPIHA